MHSVAGDVSLIFKVRTESPRALEAFLSQVHAIPGVTEAKSYVVLSTYLERLVQAEMTSDCPEHPLPA